MRLHYFSNTNLPSQSANSVHVMRMCEALAEHDCTVKLFAMKGRKGRENLFTYYGVKPNFQVEVWGAPWLKGRLYLYSLKTVLSLLRSRPEVIYTRSLVGAYYLSFTHLPFVFENHNPRNTLKPRQRRMFDRVISSPNMKRMVVISEALRNILMEETPLDEAKFIVCHDAAKTVSQTEPLTEFTLGRNQLHIGYVGTIGHGRGLELLASLAYELDWVEFHVVGCTESQAREFFNWKETPANLHFYGFVAPSATESFRQKCDILVAPYQNNLALKSGKNSSEYMSPLKIFEYMASRKAIIASDLPVIREVLNDTNAVLCPCSSIDAWKQSILRLSANPEERHRLAGNAFMDFENKYTWYKRAGGILTAITEITMNPSV